MKNKIIFLTLFLIVSCNNSSNESSNIQDDIYNLKQTAITNAIQKASGGVVGIHVETKKLVFRDRGEEIFLEGGVNGSGFLVSKDGYVITNAHNVSSIIDPNRRGQYKLFVTFSGGSMLDARIIGYDAQTDIALLKIDGEDFPYCALGNSENLSVGEFVIALGNPFNLFAESTKEPIASFGIISASNADFGVQSNGVVLDNMIQTDAAVNPGNSGGPLVDANGHVIGMNTLRRDESSNIGYAIPINKIKNIVEELKIRGSIDRGIDFGLLFINLYTNQLMVKYVHPRVVLENDLSVYDIVVSVNDTKVSSIKDFSDVIKRNDVRPGDIIKLKILRDDKIKIVNLKTQ